MPPPQIIPIPPHMLNSEARLRVAAAAKMLEYGLDGRIDLAKAIQHSRRLLAKADQFLHHPEPLER